MVSGKRIELLSSEWNSEILTAWPTRYVNKTEFFGVLTPILHSQERECHESNMGFRRDRQEFCCYRLLYGTGYGNRTHHISVKERYLNLLTNPAYFYKTVLFWAECWPLHHIRMDGRTRTYECRFELNQVLLLWLSLCGGTCRTWTRKKSNPLWADCSTDWTNAP